MLVEVVEDLVKTRLKIGQTIGFQVHTGSMWPALRPGDLLVVKSYADLLTLEIGALIVFRQDDHWIVHRLISISSTTEGLRITTKGDNVSLFDPIWDLSELCGVGVEIVRKNRHIPLTTKKVHLLGGWIARISNQIGIQDGGQITSLKKSLKIKFLRKIIQVFAFIGYTG